MDTKSFLHKINDIKELNSLPNTFWNRLKVKRAMKEIDKMIRIAAKAQADSMYKQTYKFYQDIVDTNLN